MISTRNGWSSREEVGFEEDVFDTDLTQTFRPTEVLDISIPHTSATHKVITSGVAHTQGRFLQTRI